MSKCNFILFLTTSSKFYPCFITIITWTAGARVLSGAVGGLIIPSDNPLDFHSEI